MYRYPLRARWSDFWWRLKNRKRLKKLKVKRTKRNMITRYHKPS